jgi:hypothetical protein
VLAESMGETISSRWVPIESAKGDPT